MTKTSNPRGLNGKENQLTNVRKSRYAVILETKRKEKYVVDMREDSLKL